MINLGSLEWRPYFFREIGAPRDNAQIVRFKHDNVFTLLLDKAVAL